jgi:hypothetical protein
MLPLPERYWTKDSHSLVPTSGNQVNAGFTAFPFVQSRKAARSGTRIVCEQKTKVMLDSTAGVRANSALRHAPPNSVDA